jgi:hypothetical protein
VSDNHEFYVITRNAAKCKKCGDELVSTHRHDFVRCTCGALCVDGGKEYLKRSYADPANVEEQSEYRQLTKLELIAKITYYHENDRQYGGDRQHGDGTPSYSHWHQQAIKGEALLQEWYPDTGVTDLLNQPIAIGDYVVFHNCIYVVKGLPVKVYKDGYGTVQIMLASPSDTTRPVKKASKYLVVLDKQHVEALIK